MAAKHAKKRQTLSLGRIGKVAGVVAALTAAVTLFLTNLDKLGDLGRKYLGPKPIAELQNPRNLPTDLYGSTEPVRAELVQAADQNSNARAYDLYLSNAGPDDVLISEIRFGPGAAYASFDEDSSISKSVLPTASYRVVADGGRGTVALSPPYRLAANRNGAIRVVVESPSGDVTSRGMVAIELYSADGERVASVNRMMDE